MFEAYQPTENRLNPADPPGRSELLRTMQIIMVPTGLVPLIDGLARAEKQTIIKSPFRAEVAAMAQAMELRMRFWDAVRGDEYKTLTIDDCAPKIAEHMDELLDRAVYAEYPAPAIKAAADLANYCMFMALAVQRQYACGDCVQINADAPEKAVTDLCVGCERWTRGRK